MRPSPVLSVGLLAGCSWMIPDDRPPVPGAGRDDGLWWSGGSGSDFEVIHGGHAPDGATHVRLWFGDHEPVVTEVQNADGDVIASAQP